MIAQTADVRIRALRSAKPAVDPWRAHGTLVERELRPGGRVESALTIFLAGSECPFTCSFCDLWRWTLDGPTPRGALPRQIEDAIVAADAPRGDRIKLYNASNFFDRRAVPPEDVPSIAALCALYGGVTVESHANTIGDATLRFAELLDGRLEVAMGLETIHPVATRHLNKRLDLDRFERAARFLQRNDIDLRVFVLLGVPYVPADEAVDWAVRSARFAADLGAAVVCIIPVRGGNGELERLAALGHFAAPTLAQLESALDACRGASAFTVFTADLWDPERLPACDACRDARVARMRAANLTGSAQREVSCHACP